MAKLVLFWFGVTYLLVGIYFGFRRFCHDLKQGERFWQTLGKSFLLIFLWGFGALSFIGVVSAEMMMIIGSKKLTKRSTTNKFKTGSKIENNDSGN